MQEELLDSQRLLVGFSVWLVFLGLMFREFLCCGVFLGFVVTGFF